MIKLYPTTAYILILVLLAGCGNKETKSVPPTNPPQNSANMNDDNVVVENVPIDPGPYFTPRRAAPNTPDTFSPPEQVGDFMRFQATGNCLQPNGLISQYTNSEGQIIQLQCRYIPDATTEIENLAKSNTLTGDPIIMKIQGAESFLLGVSGNAYLYAWTHDQWFFLTRSLSGRPGLDAFMESFPY